MRAANVLLATGGDGQLFAVTTNPSEATGDGVAMALRAGVAVADVEFVQFHPTALHHPAMPRPLLSEALRGHGALLRDAKGERFVDELLPRDKVSRAITTRMLEQDVDHLWLDATGLEQFAERFPTIMAQLAAVGLDPAKDWLPIAPAAHYSCGGVVADLDGASSLARALGGGRDQLQRGHGRQPPGVELAARRHGVRPPGRRGHRSGRGRAAATGAMRSVLGGGEIGGLPLTLPPAGDGAVRDRDALQRTMTLHAGVLRSAESLGIAAGVCDGSVAGDDLPSWELRNLATVGRALCASALAREESRGAHTRSDFPELRDDLRARFVISGR